MIPDFLDALALGAGTDVFAGGAALGLAGILAGTGGLALRTALRLAERRLWLSVGVDSRSPAFRHLLLWVEGERVLAGARRLRLTEVGGGRILAPAPGRHWFLWHGRIARLDRAVEDRPAGRDGAPPETLTLHLLLGTREAAEAILAAGAARAESRRGPELHVLRDGWWESLGEVQPRALATLACADDRLDRLLADLRAFGAARDWYAARGVPWRRGYLLSGPPGTGKSSAIRALASELGLGLATVDLSRPGLTDEALRDALATAPARALLVIEDVDAAFREREAGDAGARLSFSGLLNAIDGVAAQEGRPLVMTTNHPERLDPALVRPGRVDLRVELGLVGAREAEAMFLRFFPGEARLATAFAERLGPARISPAALQGHLLAMRDHPGGASDATALIGT